LKASYFAEVVYLLSPSVCGLALCTPSGACHTRRRRRSVCGESAGLVLNVSIIQQIVDDRRTVRTCSCVEMLHQSQLR